MTPQSKNYLPVCTPLGYGVAIWRGWRSSVYILIMVLTPFSKPNLACLDGKRGGKSSCPVSTLNGNLYRALRIWLTRYLGVRLLTHLCSN